MSVSTRSMVRFDARAIGKKRLARKASVVHLAGICGSSKAQMSVWLRDGIMPEDRFARLCRELNADPWTMQATHTTVGAGEISVNLDNHADSLLASARMQARFSQYKLAVKLSSLAHMTPTAAQREISHYEHGKPIPPVVAKELNAVLGTSLDESLPTQRTPEVRAEAKDVLSLSKPLIADAKEGRVVLSVESNGIAPKDAALNRMLLKASRNPEITLSDFLRDEYHDQYVSMLEERVAFLQAQVRHAVP